MTTPLVRENLVEAAQPAARPEKGGGALARLLEGAGVPCEVVLPSGRAMRFGEGEPRFRAVFHADRVLRQAFDELALGQAYVQGDLDLEGDLWSVFELRDRLRDRTPVGTVLRFLADFLLVPATRLNRKSIDFHYTLGDDFYHSFIDDRYHFYSHGHFKAEDETLEESSEHKLEAMFEALRLRPGMRLLDIGGGWGGVTRYCGSRGVHVTSLTLAQDSFNYITNVLETPGLKGEVRLEDFLEHRPERPYDAIVIYGVIEHIPNYRRFCQRAWECLAPGGRIYMDASASKEKYIMSAFTRKYIWHGTHTFLSLQDIVQEFLWNGFQVEEVKNESRDYELTMRHWGERFDAHHAFIAGRWGEPLYRAFRIYLWGGCHAFHTDRLQAYHVVARRHEEPGPRPGVGKRVRNFAGALR
ncbi:MAG: class I SAM-dependent methyltransferase [Thermoanaerobaculia bacterium]